MSLDGDGDNGVNLIFLWFAKWNILPPFHNISPFSRLKKGRAYIVEQRKYDFRVSNILSPFGTIRCFNFMKRMYLDIFSV
jgi:hypothetical protein